MHPFCSTSIESYGKISRMKFLNKIVAPLILALTIFALEKSLPYLLCILITIPPSCK